LVGDFGDLIGQVGLALLEVALCTCGVRLGYRSGRLCLPGLFELVSRFVVDLCRVGECSGSIGEDPVQQHHLIE